MDESCPNRSVRRVEGNVSSSVGTSKGEVGSRLFVRPRVSRPANTPVNIQLFSGGANREE